MPCLNKVRSEDGFKRLCYSSVFDDKWGMPSSLFLLSFSQFLFFGCECGRLFRFLVAALYLRHCSGSRPEVGMHGDGESWRLQPWFSSHRRPLCAASIVLY